jgi:predicted RNA binding protein YcfA (HicA-like mRNA interferase family)
VDKGEKLLEKARASPGGMSFREFEHLMDLKGWKCRRQSGSHRLWCSPAGYRLPVQPRGNKAKDYQVRQFLKRLDHESRM